MNAPVLTKLLGRAAECLAAAQRSVADGHADLAHLSIRSAYDLLAYIEAKDLTGRGLGATRLSTLNPQLGPLHVHD